MGLRLAVVGDPISHTRSPAIHNAAFEALDIDGSYEGIRVEASGVEGIFDRVRRGQLDGLNVTMPHKGVAAALVDRLSPEAERSRSVNTVVRQPDGKLVGYSTDVSALRRLWPEIPGKPTLILGAGGAAAAACLAAPEATIYVTTRRQGVVEALADTLEMELASLQWGTSVVEAVVVNATPLGMNGEPLPERIVELASGVIDLAYGPETTPAIALASRLGLPHQDGLSVLVAQAADSFRLWTGRSAPVEVMESVVRKSSSEAPMTPNQS